LKRYLSPDVKKIHYSLFQTGARAISRCRQVFFVQYRERAFEGGWREVRRDSMVRRFFSFVINRVTSRAVGVE
jgi:hypothetical protein